MSRPPAPVQRGIVAVELALIIPVIVLIVAVTLMFGRAFMQYGVLQKASNNALHYLSSLPAVEMTHAASGAIARATATQMVLDAGAGAGFNPLPVVYFTCIPGNCQTDGVKPVTIQLNTEMAISDPFIPNLTSDLLGMFGVTYVDLQMTVFYVN